MRLRRHQLNQPPRRSSPLGPVKAVSQKIPVSPKPFILCFNNLNFTLPEWLISWFIVWHLCRNLFIYSLLVYGHSLLPSFRLELALFTPWNLSLGVSPALHCQGMRSWTSPGRNCLLCSHRPLVPLVSRPFATTSALQRSGGSSNKNKKKQVFNSFIPFSVTS